jgi:chromosome segregation ATPase
MLLARLRGRLPVPLGGRRPGTRAESTVTPGMGLFKKRADPAELEAIKADIAAMAQRLDRSEADKTELGSRVHKLTTRLETPLAPPPAEPARKPVTESDLDILRARLQRLSDRLDGIDARITSISTELANQITELSGDVESIAKEHPPTDDVVTEIRDAQVRLANEQARYQISFREDLAEIAERLRRP